MPNFVDTIYALFPPILSWLKQRLCHFCVDQRWSEIFHIHFNFSISPGFTDDIFAGQHLSTCALRWLSTSSILVFFTTKHWYLMKNCIKTIWQYFWGRFARQRLRRWEFPVDWGWWPSNGPPTESVTPHP